MTGASGFIGSFLVEGGLERGMQVWAGVRRSSSRKYLQDGHIRFAELDFTDSDRLETQLRRHKEEHGGWDCIVHCAGVTKCLDKADFEIGNYWATRHFIEVLMRLDMVPSQFRPIVENDTPQPNTAYGVSKLHAEEYIRSLEGFPWVIFRPTGVYGPRERDYYLMAQSIKRHVDISAGFRGHLRRIPPARPYVRVRKGLGGSYLSGGRAGSDRARLFRERRASVP